MSPIFPRLPIGLRSLVRLGLATFCAASVQAASAPVAARTWGVSNLSGKLGFFPDRAPTHRTGSIGIVFGILESANAAFELRDDHFDASRALIDLNLSAAKRDTSRRPYYHEAPVGPRAVKLDYQPTHAARYRELPGTVTEAWLAPTNGARLQGFQAGDWGHPAHADLGNRSKMIMHLGRVDYSIGSDSKVRLGWQRLAVYRAYYSVDSDNKVDGLGVSVRLAF